MSKTIIGGTNDQVLTPTASPFYAPEPQPFGGSGGGTEAQMVFRIKTAGTLSNLAVHWNNVSTNRTVTQRKNSANTSQTINDTTGADAWYYNTSDTASVTTDDTIDWAWTDTGTRAGIRGALNFFEASDGSTTSLNGNRVFNNTGTATGTVYCNIIGFCRSLNSTETNSQDKIRANGGTHTLSYFHSYVITAASHTITCRFRKNAANGNSILTLTANVTGLFLDSTHSDTFTSADLIDYSLAGFSSDSIEASLQATINWAAEQYEAAIAIRASRTASANTSYIPLIGFIYAWGDTTDESQTQFKFNYSGNTLSRFRAIISTNTYASSVTWQLRKNGGNANQSLPITNGTTGWFEDTTHTDSFNSTDLWNCSISGGTSGTLAGSGSHSMITIDNTSAAAYSLAVDAGFYTLTGEAATLNRFANKSLSVATGSYSLTGEAASLTERELLVASTGFYSLTGETAALNKRKVLSAATGYYALTGEAAQLSKVKRQSIATGFYALTGEASALSRTRGVSVATGSYALTGEAATLKEAETLVAPSGYYTLSGKAPTLAKAKALSVATGFYSLTGKAPTLKEAETLVAPTGYYSLTGQTATFTKTKALSVASGFYSLTGKIASLLKNKSVNALTGFYSLTGEAVTLKEAETLVAPTGFYALTGEAATLSKRKTLAVATGFYSLTGEAAAFSKFRSLGAATGFYALAGETSALIKQKRLSCAPGSYALSGEASTLLRGKIAAAASGYYALTGEATTFSKSRGLAAASGFYALTGETAALLKNKMLSGSAGFYALTGEAASLARQKRTAVANGLYALTGEPITLTKTKRMGASNGLYSLTGETAAMLRSRIMSNSAGFYTLLGQALALSRGRGFTAPTGLYTFTGKQTVTQIASPSSDVTIGGWTTYLGSTSNLFQMIDEQTPDDNDYDQSSALLSGQSDPYTFDLGPISPPQTGPQRLYYRFCSTGSLPINMQVDLYDGAALVASYSHSNVTSGFQTAAQTLTAAQIASISDYSQLKVVVTAQAP